ncbi:MAG TPA: hypothetical protein VFC63_08970 [Blastocatellia bacterium]|nr:hypothetical protein [Blastocatellia bacterium]
MGAFNTVKAELPCPYCGQRQQWTVQFKYGNCWQFEYQIGDKLRWGGNEKGENTAGRVRTDGLAEESCKGCSRDFINAAVYFSDNIIEKVELNT